MDFSADQIEPNPIDKAPESRFYHWLFRNFTIIRNILLGGVSGSFTTVDGKTITVTKGIVTDIT